MHEQNLFQTVVHNLNQANLKCSALLVTCEVNVVNNGSIVMRVCYVKTPQLANYESVTSCVLWM